MPKRSFSGAGSYRYGFNGKENDNDVKGLGSQQDYGMRIYDARIGRFLSVDPLTRSFPMLTPYQFAENQPIWAIDLDGLEKYVVSKYYNKDKQVKEIVITVLKDKNSKELVNQDLHHNGIQKWKKDVLVRNVYIGGTTTYEHLPTLDKEQDKIYKTAKLEVNDDVGDPFGIDFGGKGNDGGQKLTSLRDDFTDKNYQIEAKRKIFTIVENRESDWPRIGYDNKNNDPERLGIIVLGDVNKIVNDFKSSNPKATDIRTTVVFTTVASNKSYVQKIADKLEALGIKTQIIFDDKFRSPNIPPYIPTSKDFQIATKVTGVIK